MMFRYRANRSLGGWRAVFGLHRLKKAGNGGNGARGGKA